jgi:hypothetical protein
MLMLKESLQALYGWNWSEIGRMKANEAIIALMLGRENR